MATLGEVASYVRSKNAGPFWVTIDIFFDSDEKFSRIADSAKIGKEVFGKIYDVDPNLIKIYRLPDIKVIKISYPRPCPQGGREDRDMHSGQQYVQILDLEV